MAEATPKRGRGRPALRPDEQRRRLLAAAATLFDAQGFERTRVADIVREAGMSSRSFYEHFASKDDLVAESVLVLGRRFVAQLAAVFRETADPLERIDRGLRAYLDLFAFVPVDLEHLGGAGGQRVREMRREVVREVSDMVIGAIEQARASGHVSRGPDRPTVELLVTGIEGLSFRYFSEGRGAELRALHPVFADLMVRAFL
jgi:AcrR family transcriptional regulator